MRQLKSFSPVFLALVGLVFLFAFIPTSQDAGQQTAVWTGVTMSATPTTTVIACGQGNGQIGRKTLAVHNGSTSGGAVTVTAELRDDLTTPNFTSGYLAVNGLAANTANSDTAVATDAGGRYCQLRAVSAVTSVVTVTLRRE